jgi:hypothetical protein
MLPFRAALPPGGQIELEKKQWAAVVASFQAWVIPLVMIT